MPYSARIKELKGQITDLRNMLPASTKKKQQELEKRIEHFVYILKVTKELQESHV